MIWGLLIYVFDFVKYMGYFFAKMLVLKILKLYFESEFSFFGGLFYKTFWFEASLHMFLIFWNLRVFLVWFLVFEHFEIVFWIRYPTFRGGLFYETFLIWGLLINFFDFLELKLGLFWVWFLVFEHFEIVFWIIIPISEGYF